MKAVLLAAGRGTRLGALTDHSPKCLLPICGRPLLDIWLGQLVSSGVDEVLVNTHHHAEQVQGFVENYCGPLNVKLSHEDNLLGSAGTLVANRGFLTGEPWFLACYADNLIDCDLRELVEHHRAFPSLATVGLFHADQPSEAGIVEVGDDGIITSFVEKPEHPVSNLANAGLYVFSEAILDMVEVARPADIGFDLLPKLVGRARGVEFNGALLDIGTPDRYEQAQTMWLEKLSRDHN